MEQNPQKESWAGVASCLGAVVSLAVIVPVVLMAAYLENTRAGGIDDSSVEALAGELLLVAAVVLNFIGILFGIAGLVPSSNKKKFPVLGIFLNLAIFVATVGMITLAALTE